MKTVTIVLPVSRNAYLDPIFARLELLVCDRARTNLLCIVDGDANLFVDVRNRVEMSKFAQRLCVQFRSSHVLRQYDKPGRRLRISDVHNELRKHVLECDYVFGVEDDTVFRTDALKRLLNQYTLHPYAGFIEGVQLGRHGILHVGAWRVDDVYDPKVITSVLPGNGLTEIDAGGLYCFLTKRDNYVNHTFKPLEGNDFGPDVDFGISMRQAGALNYIDWSVTTVHKTRQGDVSLLTHEPVLARFVKEGTRWRQKHH